MLHGPGFDEHASERELMPRGNDVSDRQRPRCHRAPCLGAGVYATRRSSLEPGRMVIMRVRNQDCGWTKTPDAVRPVRAAIDQHSTAGAINDDSGMSSMEPGANRDVPASAEERNTHDVRQSPAGNTIGSIPLPRSWEFSPSVAGHLRRLHGDRRT